MISIPFNFRRREVEVSEEDLLKLDYDIPEYECIESYWLNKPFAKAFITGDEYIVSEPRLSEEELKTLIRLKDVLRVKIFVRDVIQLKKKEEVLFKEVLRELKDEDLKTIGKIWYYIKRDFIGYGKIDPILKDRYVEDVTCSGYGLPVYVYHKAYGSLRTNVVFSKDELDDFVLRLSQLSNVQVSLDHPIADSTLPTGERVHITFKDVVSTRGSTFSIRKSYESPLTPSDLIAFNSVDPELMAFLWLCVEARKNILIIGPTASGKTTLLNAIAMFIPMKSKVVSIEDTREIRIPHENWVPFLAKDFDEMFELLKASLRQRPEYIIVGEIRGREAVVMFQAMSTGHASYATLHAKDVPSAVSRLVNDPINVPPSMFESLDYILTLELRIKGGRIFRRVKGVWEIGFDGGVCYDKVWDEGFCKDVYEDFEILGDPEYVRDELKRRTAFLEALSRRRPNFMEFVKKVEAYVKGSRKEGKAGD